MALLFDGEEKLPPPPTDQIQSDVTVQPSVTISNNHSEVFAVAWSPDGSHLAAGTGDGSISVFHAETGRASYELQKGSAAALPATALKFRPNSALHKTRNVLISTNAVGAIQHWHVTSTKCLDVIEEPDNQIYAVDYNADGAFFVTAGKDTVLRVYDETTKQLVHSLQGGAGYGPHAAAGHSNRVFAAKFHPADSNIIVSGGWDNTIQIWDSRQQRSIRSIFGPHMCGDGLDLAVMSTGKTVAVTASWRPESPLELWNIFDGERISEIPWHQSLLGNQPCLLYAAKFSKSRNADGLPRFVAAGGSGSNEARVFELSSGFHTQLVGTVAGLERGVFTVDWSPTRNSLAIGSGDGTIRILDMNTSPSEEKAESKEKGDDE